MVCATSRFRRKVPLALAVIRFPMAGGMRDFHISLQAAICLSGDQLPFVLVAILVAVVRFPMAGGMCDFHISLHAVICTSGYPLTTGAW